MADYRSEQEQIEDLKRWWKENGRVVVIGLVLGLGGVFAWKSWQTYTTNQSDHASHLYEELVNWATAENHQRINELAEELMREYPGSGYAPLAALVRAKSAFTQSRPDEARGYLQWVVDNSERVELQQLARLRLARLAIDRGDFPGALVLLDQAAPGTLLAAFEETRGDIKSAQGDVDAAREAYRAALAAPRLTSSTRTRVQMKLDDLGSMSDSDSGA